MRISSREEAHPGAGFALSPQQRQISRWLEVTPAHRRFHEMRLTLHGNLDRTRLLDAVNGVLRDHEILRTRLYSPDSCSPAAQTILKHEPLTLLPREIPAADATPGGLLLHEVPPCAVSLDEERGGSLLTLHLNAAIADDHTLVRILEVLSRRYLGLEDQPARILQYADLAAGFTSILQDPEVTRYWARRLETAPPANGTAHDLTPGIMEPDGVLERAFELHAGAQDFAEQGDPEEGRAFALWVLFSSKLTQSRHVVVAYQQAAGAPSLPSILGPTTRTLHLPFTLDWSQPVKHLLRSVQRQLADDLTHAAGFDPAWATEEPRRTLLAYQPASAVIRDFAGLRVARCQHRGIAEPYHLKLREEGSLLQGVAPVNAAVPPFREVCQNFERWLTFCGTNAALPMGCFEWRSGDLIGSRLPGVRPPSPLHSTSSIRHAIQHQAATSPHGIAIEDVHGTMTYGELALRVNAVVGHLRHSGVGAGQLVALHLERCRDWPLYWLACWALNAIVLPLSTRDPPARLLSLLSLVPVSHIVSRELLDFAAGVPVIRADAPSAEGLMATLDPEPPPESAAYVLFTSGSTGQPKPVVISHGALSNYLTWARERYTRGARGGTLVHSEHTFDFTQTSLWLPLFAGETVRFMAPGAELRHLKQRMQATGLAFVKLTPAHLQGLAALEILDGPLTTWPAHVIVGGEALHERMLPASLRCSGSHVHNEYGPTEAAVGCSVFTAAARDIPAGAVPIGQPCEGCGLWILDEFLNRVPAGVEGELYIEGRQLASGYANSAAETACRFIPHPFTSAPGARLYRTGDRAKRRADGDYEFSGRQDSQIKVRGHRVEPGEITGILLSHPQVLSAHTVTLQRTGADPMIRSYIVTQQISAPAVQAWLSQQLPPHLLPNEVIEVPRLICNAHGKVDEPALLRLCPPDSGGPCISSPLEQQLLELWQRVLGNPAIGVDTSFFNAGGDSIRSIQLVAEARRQGVELTLAQVFDFPTVRQLARHAIVRAEPAAAVPLAEAFELISPADRARLAQGVEDAYPLAHLQLGMIFHHDADRSRSLYHDIFSYRLELEQELDRACLQQAARHLVERHAALRTTFDLTSYEEPLQLVWAEGTQLLEWEDLRELDAQRQSMQIAACIEREKRRGFDLGTLPLVRLIVHELGARRIQFTTSFHHAVLDGWSDQQIHTELFEEYGALRAGLRTDLTAPRCTYRSYIAQERQALLSRQTLEFWTGYLAGYAPPELTDTVATGEFYTVSVSLPPAMQTALKDLARQRQVALRSVLLSAHFAALASLTGQSDIVSCVVTNCRPAQLDGHRAVGLYINSLPLRVRVPAGPWSELIGQVEAGERGLFPHRYLPLDQIQQHCATGRLSESLFYFTHFHNGLGSSQDSRLLLLEEQAHEVSSFPLTASFNLEPVAASLSLRLTLDAGRISRAMSETLREIYENALQSLARPGRPRLEPEQLLPRARQSVLANVDGAALWPREDLIVRFEEHARTNPSRTALTGPDRTLSYAALNQWANRLAHRLRQKGLQAEDRVAVLTGRDSTLVVAILAVLKAGGAFVLVEEDQPRRQRDDLLQRSRWVIAPRKLLEPLSLSGVDKAVDPLEVLHSDSADLGISAQPRQAAYVMHTSGSTGASKGVVVERAAYANLLGYFSRALAVGAHDTVLATSATSFDISLLEIGLPLANGARLQLLERPMTTDAASLMSILSGSGATVMQATPTLWRLLRRNGWSGHPQLTVLSGGEQLPPELAAWLLRSTAQAWNLYGPTETTIWSSARRPQPGLADLGDPDLRVGFPSPRRAAGQGRSALHRRRGCRQRIRGTC